MTLEHPTLVDSLRKAYSAERAAAFAYIGHAASLKKEDEIRRVREIEVDEWNHREHVGRMLAEYGIPISRWYEAKFFVIGKIIGFSCHLIGRFMPYFFAGKLESGNVCEYFVMLRQFHGLGITRHDEVLYEMGIKEKEHEVVFADMVRHEPWLPWFERVFSWGPGRSLNDVNLDAPRPVDDAEAYCRRYREGKGNPGGSRVGEPQSPV